MKLEPPAVLIVIFRLFGPGAILRDCRVRRKASGRGYERMPRLETKGSRWFRWPIDGTMDHN